MYLLVIIHNWLTIYIYFWTALCLQVLRMKKKISINLIYYVHYYLDFFFIWQSTLIHNCVDDWKSSNIIDLITEVMVYCNASNTLICNEININHAYVTNKRKMERRKKLQEKFHTSASTFHLVISTVTRSCNPN